MKNIFKCLIAVTFFSFTLNVKAISNIKVGDYELSPYFSDYITKYNVYVDSEVENINISVTESEDDDYVTGIGNTILSDGKNEVILKVIKKNQEIITYEVDIFKNYQEDKDLDDANLTKLVVNGYDINFDPDVHEYNINVIDDVRLNIDYETKSSESSVRITGNSNFREGKNEVRVIVNSKDKSNTNVYTLYVNKIVTTFEEESSEVVEINILGRDKLTKKETNAITVSLISICSIIIMFLFYLLFILNRRKH